ncbi:MAG: hypothetical protein DRI46_10490 [Chloroflexi bacterium]|nr:MAG: hypothetical protein DRI46_10490 [Chloroflexota bacterium]
MVKISNQVIKEVGVMRAELNAARLVIAAVEMSYLNMDDPLVLVASHMEVTARLAEYRKVKKCTL